jgi:hypothetical protein
VGECECGGLVQVGVAGNYYSTWEEICGNCGTVLRVLDDSELRLVYGEAAELNGEWALKRWIRRERKIARASKWNRDHVERHRELARLSYHKRKIRERLVSVNSTVPVSTETGGLSHGVLTTKNTMEGLLNDCV